MKVLLFLTLIYAFSAWAQGPQKSVSEYDSATDDIAENLEAGAFLIFNCEEKRWVCVRERFYKDCSEKRTRDLASVDDPFHTCAPIEKLPNKKSCFQRQLFLVSRNYGHRVCIKESFKEKNLEF